MTIDTDPAIGDGVAAVRATFDELFARIDGWRDAIESLVADHDVTGADLDVFVEGLVVPPLSEPEALIIGAGFVATPDFLADAPWHLAWWLGHANTFGAGSADPGIRRLEAVEDATAETFRDYTTLEWWRVPAASGQRHITGPYVDYLCTDDYTLTLTTPVRRDGTMIGVVGADLYVNDVEHTLLPRVRAIGGTATLVNASGRVVVSADPHRATGTLLRRGLTSENAVACGDTSLVLVLE